MNYAYLALGGNIGNKLENMNKTQELINLRAGLITSESGIYATAAWGNTQQPDFYNKVIRIETGLSAVQLLEELLAIETQMGRVRTAEKWTERTMDLDILFYNDAIISEPHLKVPHPYIQERKFVLAPLAEIAESYVHPALHKTIGQLLSECSDASEIKRLTF
ncbi:MAG: 2-amino-4-hydroxy-6-hydroxymethyldihydropteridine pyrophosphokinae [Bacteroidetes bacterium]|nr:2-amino-4-hydroxy-6-hydroxymethyldihydropteridine pyrophosphokinae [Bacteroidota bacterium]